MDQKIKILLIEDNPGDARLIEEMLKEADVRVELKCVELLSSAREQIQSDGFDIILLDLGLPDSQGLGTLRKLNEIGPAAPVIVLTGIAAEEVGTQAVKEGAQDYLIKGQIDKNQLLRSINYAIERAKLEASVNEQRKRFETFFDNSITPLAFLDRNFNFIRVNKAYADTGKREVSEFPGHNHFEFYPSDAKTTFEEVVRTRKAFQTFARPFIYADHPEWGVTYWNWTLVPIMDNNGEVEFLAFSLVDVTEKRKLEEQLLHAQKMEAVGVLAGGIAHDFNNILNVIMGYGNMVMDRIGDDQLSRDQMNEVLAAAERAANLTKRLLVFSRKQVVDVKPIDVNETILGIQKMLVRIIRENIDFNLDLADRQLIVMADAGQIEQVLINLATNARDAMPEGGRLTISTELQELDDDYVAAYGYGKPGKYALITVADTGHGMDAETQKKIFEPFFTTKDIGEGTGLGLAISYGIIKQHDGYIKVYSEPGQGAVFKIYLPLIEDTTVLGKKTEAPVTIEGGNETILVAEDDTSLRKLTRIVLESFGYSVITAEDGEDAIAKFMENREKLHLVILDMIMPKKNGKEVSEVITKKSPGMKILFASGYTMDMIKTRELTESGFDFILKPILPKDLLRRVREILDR